MRIAAALLFLALSAAAGCPVRQTGMSVPPDGRQGCLRHETDRNVCPTCPLQVTATWYGMAYHGRLTAWHYHGNPGYRFDAWAPVAAHNTPPLGSWVTVMWRGRRLPVQIVDRGPTAPGVDLDLSEGAALQLGVRSLGKVSLEMEVLPWRSAP